MKKRTIKDIAKIAGVDHSTVSRALNDSERVAAKTKQRILAIAQELDFEFHAAGRNLRRGSSGNIAVLCSGNWRTFDMNQYTSRLLDTIRFELERRELDAFILEAHNPETGQSNIRRLINQHKVDGFIIADERVSPDEYQFIKHHGIPLVQLHSRPDLYPVEQLDYVLTDHHAGGRLAAEHLLAGRRRRLINITARNPLTYEFSQRLEGFSVALKESGIQFGADDILSCGCSFQAGYQLVHTHIDRIRQADGIFAQADIVALGCLTALRELGIGVPGQIALVGYDDTPLCMLSVPTITSIHQPLEDAASSACDRIVELTGSMEHLDNQPQQRLLLPRLVERGSTYMEESI